MTLHFEEDSCRLLVWDNFQASPPGLPPRHPNHSIPVKHIAQDRILLDSNSSMQEAEHSNPMAALLECDESDPQRVSQPNSKLVRPIEELESGLLISQNRL